MLRDRIIAEMKRNDINAKTLSYMTGCNYNTICRFIRGEGANSSTVEKISLALGFEFVKDYRHTEYIDVSMDQKEPCQEVTEFTHIDDMGRWVKLPKNSKHRPDIYQKIIITSCDDDGFSEMIAYVGSTKELFRGYKGEEFND